MKVVAVKAAIMARPCIYDLGRLYLLLPNEGEFRAKNFANEKSPIAIGKMLTRLEDAGFLASRRVLEEDAKVYWKIPVMPDLPNMHLRKCMEAIELKSRNATHVTESNLFGSRRPRS
ncbi:MAG: hypothetical protein ACE5KO_05865 [Candidatus Bathyarchaeia archaeon]